MPVQSGDFTGLSALIYDVDGTHLSSTVVTVHDRKEQRIQVKLMPPELRVNSNCKLLVLSSPSPLEYQGRVKLEGKGTSIAIFQGHEKESRGATRYSVNTPALIDNLLYDDQPYPLHTPVKATLINISTGGVRFSAPYNSFSNGDSFRMHIEISNTKKRLIAKVVNHVDREPEASDYGCRFT